jgi:hypothetical protein
MRWVAHVACMGDMRNAYTMLIGNLKKRAYSEDLGVVGKIILEWLLGK